MLRKLARPTGDREGPQSFADVARKNRRPATREDGVSQMSRGLRAYRVQRSHEQFADVEQRRRVTTSRGVALRHVHEAVQEAR